MKKIVALALTVVMVLGLLAGCEKPMDAQTLAQKMDEAVKAQSGMSGQMAIEMDMSMGITGMTMDMGVDAEVEYKAAMDGSKMYMGMTMDMEVMGQNETMEMDMYMETADGKMVSYTYNGMDDSWVKQEMEAADTTELQGAGLTLGELPAEALVLAEEKELVGEKECYVLTVTTTGEQVQTMIEAMLEQLDEETKAMLEGADWSALNGTMVYHIDAESFLPVQLTGEVTGLGEAMNSLLSGVMAEMMGMLGGEEMEITIDIPTCKVSMTELVYGEVEIPEVPEEGIEAAALNPLQADGSYVLRMNEDAVRVVLPEGYSAYMAETDVLMALTDDYLNSVTYTLVTDVTGEDLKLEVEAEAAYAQQEGYYKSHGEGETINGFTTMSVLYNDETASHYAWKQMDSALLFVMVNVSGEIEGLDTLLTSIEDYEG